MSLMWRLALLCLCVYVVSSKSSAKIVDENKAKKDPLSDKKHFSDGEHNAEYDHEAFVGAEEASKYEHLTPEQSKERLGKFLPIIDKDADGFLVEDELKDHIKFMQRRYITKDVDRTWNNFDKEKLKDGKLPWEMYKLSVYGPDDSTQESAKEYEQMKERDQRRWKMADRSGDGALDKEEYGCFMHPEDCEHMKDIIVTETVEDIDKNKDGLVDIEEYIGDMYRPADHPEEKGKGEPDWVKSEREMFKTYRDKNADGKLDKDELREWILPSGFDHAEAEARHLLHLADDNKDNKLSKDEILAHYDAFVGSQATDYGEQLQKHDPSEL